jgi:hypothetical protein
VASLLEQLEDELLQRQLPAGCLIDLDLGSSNIGKAGALELERWAKSNNFEYVRGSHVDRLRAFRHLARGHLDRTAKKYEVVVVLSAKSHSTWRERKGIVAELAEEYAVAPVFLTRTAVERPEEAKAEVARALLRHWNRLPPPATVSDNENLGNTVREVAECEPFVLVVCGNEKQQQAAGKFPERVRLEFGIEGQWLFTDYKRPERVVEEIEVQYGRLGDRLVLVAFAQFFNATNAKRDGMGYLRKKKVLSITRDFKSLGSALEAVKVGLSMYVQGQSDPGEKDEEHEEADENEKPE